MEAAAVHFLPCPSDTTSANSIPHASIPRVLFPPFRHTARAIHTDATRDEIDDDEE
jgi:hypothetical protein